VEQLNPIKNSDLYEMKNAIKKTEELKDFKEYENISPGNFVITIEYCSSCEEHFNITQHGVDKIFRELALKFKKIITERFSFIKVYLKPIDVDIVKNTEFKIILPDNNGKAYPRYRFRGPVSVQRRQRAPASAGHDCPESGFPLGLLVPVVPEPSASFPFQMDAPALFPENGNPGRLAYADW
jgi:hypothetical protein